MPAASSQSFQCSDVRRRFIEDTFQLVEQLFVRLELHVTTAADGVRNHNNETEMARYVLDNIFSLLDMVHADVPPRIGEVDDGEERYFGQRRPARLVKFGHGVPFIIVSSHF